MSWAAPHARGRAYGGPDVHPMAVLEDQLGAIDQHFLIPESIRVRQAIAQLRRLADGLKRSGAWMFDVQETLRHGSLSRGTALRSFDDIDAFIILDERALLTREGAMRSAEDTIRRMAHTLSEVFVPDVANGEMHIRRQTHSVGVTFTGLGFRVDLVPARREAGRLLIPSRRAGEWIETWPEEARARLDHLAADKPWVKRAIRLMKGWREQHGIPLPSYAVEALVVSRASESDKLIAGLIYGIFKELADAHCGHRLQLVGARDNPPPLLIADPDSKANIADGLDAQDRAALIRAGRGSLDTLKTVLADWRTRPPPPMDQDLLALFVPRG